MHQRVCKLQCHAKEAIKSSLETLQASLNLRDIVFSTHERRAALCASSFFSSEPEILAEGVHHTNLSEELLDLLDLRISPNDLALLPLLFRLPEQRIADLSGDAWLANSRGRAVALEKCWMCVDSGSDWDFVYRISTKTDIADFDQELSNRVINHTLRKLIWVHAICHNCVCHNYLSHNYLSHNYLSHNYLSPTPHLRTHTERSQH